MINHYFPMCNALDYAVYSSEPNNVWGAGVDFGVNPSYVVKGYLHVLEPREGSDVRPNSEHSSVTSGGVYQAGEFVTQWGEPTIRIGSIIVRVGDEDNKMYTVQDIVKQEVSPFTGWQPTKRYKVALWIG